MSPTFVITSSWWLDASPQACWPLVAEAGRWPTWWRSVPAVGALPRPGEHAGPPRHWRALLGLPLRLRAGQRSAEPCQRAEWQIRGDLHARLTWVLASAPPGGCDVTCRWEIEPVPARPDWLRSLACLLLERSHFGRMRACASDMGAALGCRSAQLREWSGLAHR
jgi:hypothetical protein